MIFTDRHYLEFEEWFKRKSDKKAIVFEDTNGILGFLHLKREEDALNDIVPPLPPKVRLKIATFKIDAHGTKLGERFLKKIFDYCHKGKIEELYVTVFPKHSGLISLFERFGFIKVGEKRSQNGVESVYLRPLINHSGDPLKDYPIMETNGNKKYILAIKPEYHSRLFPDSILKNESYDLIKDVSFTNSIHKIYITKMKDIGVLRPKDILIIYRTTDQQGPARFRSVATSACTVLEVRPKNQFPNFAAFVNYCEPYSVFEEAELLEWWNSWGNQLFAIKMLYNGAFSQKITRGNLIEQIGVPEDAYWGFVELTDDQFLQICGQGSILHLLMQEG